MASPAASSPRPADAVPSHAARGASIRKLLALSKQEWPRLAGGSAFLLLASGMTLLYPQAMRIIIDNALVTRDQALVDRAALAMGAIFVVQSIAVAGRFVLFSTAGEKIVARLREDLYRSLIRQEVAFFDERRTGELTNRLSSDTTVLQSTVSANVSMGLRNVVSIVGGVGMLLYTSPVLTALMLGIVPPVALGAVAYGRRVRGLSRAVQDALAEASEVAEESLSGIRTVRAFSAEDAEAARYGKSVAKSYELARRRAIASATFMGAASFGAYMAAAVVLWYGGRLVLADRLTVGGLTSFLIYSMYVAFALGSLGELWADFMRALGAGERVFELLDRVPTIPSSGGRILEKVEGRVSFRNVVFAYPSRRDVGVLRGIDLEVASGELVAIVGASGAGKSTIAALLARLYDPDEGAVLLDGVDLRVLDPAWLRRQIGAVAQEPILFSTTVAENIRYGRVTATDAEVESAARAANAHTFIEAFPEKYKTMVGERGIQLSGGQKQRVAIARAVLKDPRILVLDEATSALDAESEYLVKEALERLMHGRTTLVIAHRLSTVVDADRVLVLEGGKVVQSGAHGELLVQEGLYRRLVERQFVHS